MSGNEGRGEERSVVMIVMDGVIIKKKGRGSNGIYSTWVMDAR